MGGEGVPLALSFSPNGDAMAYCNGDGRGLREVYAEPYPLVNGSIYRITDNGCNPYWTGGEKINYQVATSATTLTITTVEISLPSFTLNNRQELPFDVSATSVGNAGKSSDSIPGTDRMLILVEEESADSLEVVIVENLLEEIERLLPTE